MSQSNAVWTDPRCTVLDLPMGMRGPFVDDGNGGVLTTRGNQVQTSADGGETWSEPRTLYEGPGPGIPGGGLLQRTRDGAIVYVLHRYEHVQVAVDNRRGRAFRQQAPRRLVGAQPRQRQDLGRPPARARRLLRRPHHDDPDQHGRDRRFPYRTCSATPAGNVTQTHVSPDDGASWEHSNTIDLGGHGDHDGAYEATLTELRDGRIWMLIRTNWDRFWEALSEDAGRSWRTIRPTDIDMSSTPGYITRLESGRLALVWKPALPQGPNVLREEDGQVLGYSDGLPARGAVDRLFGGRRSELDAIAGDSEGQPGRQAADTGRRPGGQHAGASPTRCSTSASPGEIWISTSFQGHLRVSLQEKGFL